MWQAAIQSLLLCFLKYPDVLNKLPVDRSHPLGRFMSVHTDRHKKKQLRKIESIVPLRHLLPSNKRKEM